MHYLDLAGDSCERITRVLMCDSCSAIEDIDCERCQGTGRVPLNVTKHAVYLTEHDMDVLRGFHLERGVWGHWLLCRRRNIEAMQDITLRMLQTHFPEYCSKKPAGRYLRLQFAETLADICLLAEVAIAKEEQIRLYGHGISELQKRMAE